MDGWIQALGRVCSSLLVSRLLDHLRADNGRPLTRSPAGMLPCYRSIDHIMLRLPAAEPLFDLFSSVFELPVAWPLQRAGFATYGWVHVGNTDLEFWAATDNSDLPSHAPAPLVHGFALEPALPLSLALASANASGIATQPARSYQSLNAAGEVVTNFTNAALLDVSAPSCCVFFCEWDPGAAIYPWDEALTPAQRRARHRRALRDCGGGPLGLIGLNAMRMETPDLAEHRCHWEALAGPAHGEAIALTPEISLELVPGDHLRIQSLSFSVRSLAQARGFLASRQLLAGDTGNVLSVDCAGLNIRLVEPGGPGTNDQA